jgi:hypothetical protein
LGGREHDHRVFVAALSSGERLLISLRDELYDGEWGKMLLDLRDRLEKRPYIFKLSSRIECDMTVIERLSRYETEHGINLRDYVGGAVGGDAVQ